MKIKIKPIIRQIAEPDKLVDVIDIDGEQTAVIVRAYPTRTEAQKHDGVTLDEELDVTEFLTEKSATQEAAAIQAIKNEAFKFLRETDYAIIKIAEGASTKEDYAEVILKRQEARLILQ